LLLCNFANLTSESSVVATAYAMNSKAGWVYFAAWKR